MHHVDVGRFLRWRSRVAAMTNCATCAERRRAIIEAWQDRQVKEAVRQAALGVKDMVKKIGEKK